MRGMGSAAVVKLLEPRQALPVPRGSCPQAMSIQYHPEASPGPHDSDICFDQFIEMLEAERSGQAVPT